MSKSKKTKPKFVALALSAAFVFVACSQQENEYNKISYSESDGRLQISSYESYSDFLLVPINSMVCIGGDENPSSGGDEFDWYHNVFGFWFNQVPGHMIDFVGFGEFHNWTTQFGRIEYGFRDWREANLRTMIEEFSLTKNDMILSMERFYGISINKIDELVNWGRNHNDPEESDWLDAQIWAMSYSISDIQALFSNDVNEIWAAFPGQGVLYNDRAYSPEWLLSNTERAIYGELIPLHDLGRVIERADFHQGLSGIASVSNTILQTAHQTLNTPTLFTLNFNLNPDSNGIAPFSDIIPNNINQTTLNAWDEILNTLAENHNDFPLQDPTREGYIFSGWYLDANFTAQITDTFRMPARNTTLYARWQNIEAAQLPQIQTTNLPNTSLGQTYNRTLQAISTTPVTWSILSADSGSSDGSNGNDTIGLPTGLTLNPTTGVISGTLIRDPRFIATENITYTFTVKAENEFGYTTRILSIAVSAPPTTTQGLTPQINNPLPGVASFVEVILSQSNNPFAGTVGQQYTLSILQTQSQQQPTPQGLTWSIVSGNLPQGLNINPNTGVISGIPTSAGNFGFTVQVTGEHGSIRFVLRVDIGL